MAPTAQVEARRETVFAASGAPDFVDGFLEACDAAAWSAFAAENKVRERSQARPLSRLRKGLVYALRLAHSV